MTDIMDLIMVILLGILYIGIVGAIIKDVIENYFL